MFRENERMRRILMQIVFFSFFSELVDDDYTADVYACLEN